MMRCSVLPVLAAVLMMLATPAQSRAIQEDALDADMYRMLEELERFYSQAGRPRIGRRDLSEGPLPDSQQLAHALILLQLQSLDRFVPHQRPRYGKRAEIVPDWKTNANFKEAPDFTNLADLLQELRQAPPALAPTPAQARPPY